MQNFKSFIAEQKNTHMTHIEDRVLYGGVKGTRESIMALRSLRDMLGGSKKGKVSVKWDGAPAIFAGIDPRDGEFFVAKKGIFNKNPKVYKTPAEIDNDMSGDLADKMKEALKHLPALGIEGVVQGDFLYGPGDLKKKTIDGTSYVTFHPNTIVYAVPYDQSKEIRDARIGIVWHTTYKGRSFETMKASYGVDVSKFRTSKKVWSQDAMLRSISNATLSVEQTKRVNGHLANAGKLFNKIAGSTLRSLEANQGLAQLIEQYNNTFVRQGVVIKDSRKHAAGLIKWIRSKYRKEIMSRKTERGKEGQKKKMKEILSFFDTKNTQSLVSLFDLQREIVSAKIILINKLNELQNIDTFVKTSKGYKVTGAEGYVAIDTLGGDAVKLVDRMEFSYNNFSPDVLKGWDSKSRN